MFVRRSARRHRVLGVFGNRFVGAPRAVGVMVVPTARCRTSVADPLPPTALFGSVLLYGISVFQGPFVWSQIDQWSTLWDAEARGY